MLPREPAWAIRLASSCSRRFFTATIGVCTSRIAFAPEVWLQGPADEDWPLIPFSAGPAKCPGRQLVELFTSLMLARPLEGADFELTRSARLQPERPLPGTLDHYTLRSGVRA